MDTAVVRNMVERLGALDAAGADRTTLQDAATCVARIRAWLDGREVAIAAQMAGVSSFPRRTWPTPAASRCVMAPGSSNDPIRPRRPRS